MHIKVNLVRYAVEYFFTDYDILMHIFVTKDYKVIMDKILFKELLKNAKLSKKEFAELLEIPYATANSWGNNGRDYPYWIKLLLTLYIENKECKELKQIIRENVCKED